MRSAAAGVASIDASFQQEKHLPILAHPLISEGRFVFQRPDALRWEYLRPVRSVLLLNAGKTQRFVQSGDGLAADRGAGLQAMNLVLDEMRLWLNGDFERSQTFAARLEAAGRIVLTPRADALADFIQRIEIELDAKPGVIRTVTIYEDAQSFTRIAFHNVRLNAPVDPRLFEDAS
jgi:outer membrane lipoprotein-sorting protein